MKKNAYIINISRGGIIQTESLVETIKSKEISGAVLDVFDEEPLPKEHELWTLDNVAIAPYISGPSLSSDIVKIFLENLVRSENNKNLKGVVDLKKEY